MASAALLGFVRAADALKGGNLLRWYGMVVEPFLDAIEAIGEAAEPAV